MKANIGEILSRSWKIVWKFKVLWIFGILAGCSNGSGNRFNYNTGSSDWNSNTGQMPEYFQRFLNLQPGNMAENFFQQYMGLVATLLVLLCIVWLVFFMLGFIGKTALIRGASLADGGTESLKFGSLWKESLPYFWKMVGLNLIIGLPYFIITLMLLTGMGLAAFFSFKNGIPSTNTSILWIGVTGVIVMILCLVGIIASILNIILDQAQNALILENKGIIESWVRGWNIVKSAWVTILFMAIIMSIIGSIAGFIMAIPLITVIIPATIGITMNLEQGIPFPLTIAAGMFVLYLPVLLVLNGILQSYSQSVWTLTFLRLTAPPSQAE